MNTKQLVAVIAQRTFLPEQTIRLVLDTFTKVVIDGLAEEGYVKLAHFGSWRTGTRRVAGKPDPVGVIRFRASKIFKETVNNLKETVMDKYGVILDDKAVDKLTKEATDKAQCPSCGEKLTSIAPPHCPNCGVEPFSKNFNDISMGYSVTDSKEDEE